MKRLVEIRTYRLRAGAADEFHAAVVGVVMPMLRRWKTDVVAFGPAVQEPDGYFLIRAYDDLADLQARQDAFYGSDEWKRGPREAIVGRIDSYLSTVVAMTQESVDDLRRSNAASEPSR